MTGPQLSLAQYVAGLPGRVGHPLIDQATVTTLGARGRLLGVLVLDATDADHVDAALSALAAAAPQPVTGVISTVHDPCASPAAARARSQALAARVAGAGLPAPNQIAVRAGLGWAVGQRWPPLRLDLAAQALSGGDLVYGQPGSPRYRGVRALEPRSGALRDAIADAMPAVSATATALATVSPRQWRANTTSETCRRLCEPGAPGGAPAAESLLALSDAAVRATVLAWAARSGRGHPSAGTGPDHGHLTHLVTQAPPGLIEGPATVLAVSLAARGAPDVAVEAAALMALADNPESALAKQLLFLTTAGRSCNELMPELVGPADQTDNVAVQFASGPGRWPDPLAGGTYPAAGLDWSGYRADDPLAGVTPGPADACLTRPSPRL